MKGYIRFQVNASSYVIAYLKNEATASFFTYVIDCSLYGSCVERCPVGFCTKIGYVVIFCLEMRGKKDKKAKQDREMYINLTHDGFCCLMNKSDLSLLLNDTGRFVTDKIFPSARNIVFHPG